MELKLSLRIFLNGEEILYKLYLAIKVIKEPNIFYVVVHKNDILMKPNTNCTGTIPRT